MENLSLLLSCSRQEFRKVVKSEKVKCDDLDTWLHCTIMYAGDYHSLVKDARNFNRSEQSSIYFVYITHKF